MKFEPWGEMVLKLKRFWLVTLLMVGSSVAFCVQEATDAKAAPPNEGKQVTFRSEGDTVSGVLFTPGDDGNPTSGTHGKRHRGRAAKLPALVVIHEWWGLNDQIKGEAAKWAQKGYVTLAVDLYRGQVAHDPEEAHELMRGLSQDRGVADLRAAVAYLKSRADVDKRRIGAIGWCMGGGFALQLAIHEPTLAAVNMNYGAVTSEPASLKPIHAQLLGLFGGKDRGITPDDVRKFEAEMKKLGKKVEVKIYPNSGHAFQNPENKAGYNAEDTADAEKLQEEFFKRALK